MAGNLFDVFVVGSADPSAAGETRLATALSTQHGIPLETAAKSIAAKNLRAGHSLDQAQAQALVRQLQAIGGMTVIRPAARSQSPSPATQVPAPSLPPPRSPVPPSAAAMGRTLLAGPAASSAWSGSPASQGKAPNPAFSNPQTGSHDGASLRMTAAGRIGAHDPFAPLSPSPATASAPGTDPFQPRRAFTPSLATATRTPQSATATLSNQAPATADGMVMNDEGSEKLQLARSDRGISSDEIPVLPSRSAVSAGSLREIGMVTPSGVAKAGDQKNLNLARCVQHGLYYDKTKASGCRKCLSTARDFVAKMQPKSEGFRVGDFGDKPGKRAFLGLAFALVIGFLPAAYYCFGPGATLARNLRVDQELLSRQPGTEEVLRRFDELDNQVDESHGRTTRNTGIVWIAVASVAMFGWYKIT